MIDLLRVAIALVTVFGLLGLLYLFSNRAKANRMAQCISASSLWPRGLRSSGRRAESDSIRVLSRTSLTGSHQLHLIRAGTETFLVCTHANGCTLLRAASDDAAWNRDKPEGAAVEGLKRYAS